MALVKVHGVAGAVNDEDALAARGLEGLIHGGGQFRDALGGAGAVVLVPHVADHQGGAGGVPGDGFLDDGGRGGTRGREAGAGVQSEGLGGGSAPGTSQEQE